MREITMIRKIRNGFGLIGFFVVHFITLSCNLSVPSGGETLALLNNIRKLAVIGISLGSIPSSISEGSSQNLAIRLTNKPSTEQIITISSDCVCFDFNGNTTSTLTFTPDNALNDQIITITALADSNTTNESGKVTISGNGIQESNFKLTNSETGRSNLTFTATSFYSEGDTVKVKMAYKPKENYTTTLSTPSLYSGLTITNSTFTFTPENYSTGQTFISIVNSSNFLSSGTDLYTNYQILTVIASDNGKISHSIFLDFDKTLNTVTNSNYTDNGNGTITDGINNLIWQKCNGNQTGNDCSGGTEIVYNRIGAINYCDSLILGSNSNWRLPTISELSTLINKNNSPKIHSIFTSSQGNYASSSISKNMLFTPTGEQTSISLTNLEVKYVNFTNGSIGEGVQESNAYLARCVRK